MPCRALLVSLQYGQYDLEKTTIGNEGQSGQEREKAMRPTGRMERRRWRGENRNVPTALSLMSCWTFLEASAIVLGLVGRVEKKERKKFMGLV